MAVIVNFGANLIVTFLFPVEVQLIGIAFLFNSVIVLTCYDILLCTISHGMVQVLARASSFLLPLIYMLYCSFHIRWVIGVIIPYLTSVLCSSLIIISSTSQVTGDQGFDSGTDRSALQRNWRGKSSYFLRSWIQTIGSLSMYFKFAAVVC